MTDFKPITTSELVPRIALAVGKRAAALNLATSDKNALIKAVHTEADLYLSEKANEVLNPDGNDSP